MRRRNGSRIRWGAGRWALWLAVACGVVACGRGDAEKPPSADPVTRRTLGQGEIVGSVAPNGAHDWRGVPFAAPPVGADRWRAPRPPVPWQGVRSAVKDGRPCIQVNGPLASDSAAAKLPTGAPAGSEDCLTLNVFAPAFEPDAVPQGDGRLPVMVWIHGGGNSIGSAKAYDGSVLAANHRLIVVAIQYRLGVMGWFSHASLATGDVDDASGNYGTLDVIRALEWVRDEIAAFGGDPDRVTIFGESAGGRNVFSLLASPRAGGLFQRAIVQSGSTRSTAVARARNFADDPDAPGHPFSSGEVLLSLLRADGRAADRDTAKEVLRGMTPQAIAGYLRGKTPAELIAVFGSGGPGGMYDFPQHIRDGHVLSDAPLLERFRKPGSYNVVPVIVGSNRDEMKLFLLASSDAVRRIRGIPLWFRDERRFEVMAQYQSLAWKARGVDEPAAALRRSQGPSVFAYRFDWDEEPKVLWLDLSKLVGAAHGFEIPFVFGGLDFFGAERLIFDDQNLPAARTLAERMSSYWAEFAYNGDPGRGRSGELLQWHAWDPSSPGAPRFMIFDTELGGGLRMSSDSVTTESVVERAQADPLFLDQGERCEFLRHLLRKDQGYGERDYAAGPCSGYPLADHPLQDR